MARILVVEDSSTMRAYIRASLEEPEDGDSLPQEGAEVVEAASGFDALRLLPRGRWDLVVSDINMPDINGLELARFMRSNELYRHVGLVVVSTQGSERDKRRALELGADVFLAKPFTPEELREAVAVSLRARQAPARAGRISRSGET